MRRNELPALAARDHALITMAPTRGALDAYLEGFSFSNPFSSPPTASAEQRRHDLFPMLTLAGSHDDDLLPWPPPSLDGLPVHLQAAKQQAWEGHERQQRWLVLSLGAYWATVLPTPEQDVAGDGVIVPAHVESMVTRHIRVPAWQRTRDVSLPDARLIQELRRDRAAHHLMLQVARHELLCVDALVRAWCARADPDRPMDPHDPCLPLDVWGLLRTRARRSARFAFTETSSAATRGRRRDDAPGERRGHLRRPGVVRHDDRRTGLAATGAARLSQGPAEDAGAPAAQEHQ